MFEAIKKMLTEGDNQTWCPVRVVFGVGIAVYHGLVGAGFYTHDLHFDIDTLGKYGEHMLKFILSGGAAVGVKALGKADAPKEQ
jgi:hypothetical protein